MVAPALPAFNSTAWSDVAFAGAAPRPRLTVSEWADRYRVVAAGTSPEPDRWRTSRAPYLREPMDAISDPGVEKVTIMAGSQLGKSELVLNAIGYYADADPSPILLVQPNENASKSFVKERVEPTFKATPALSGKLADGLRDKGNTVLLKVFPGGYMAIAWATSATALASRPIRVVLLDEVDRYPATLGNEGSPIELASQRTANFHNRKNVAVSTPTTEGLSPIAARYDESDRRRYHVPCPLCGAFQVLVWGGIVYKAEDGTVDLDNVYYRCAHCAGRIDERDKGGMLEAGTWIAETPGGRHRGYQISGLYSPWVRWRELVEQWIRVTSNRDQDGLREFVNLKLGETWNEHGQRVTAEQLEGNREAYPAEVPDGVRLITVGVDVQDARLEVEVVGWGAGKESWGLHYEIIQGDTTAPETWAQLDALLARPWHKADGTAMAPWRVFVDSGGHRTDEVYEFTKARAPRVSAIKGRGGPGQPLINDKPSIVGQRRAMLFFVGADAAKDAVFSRLRLDSPGPGFCHFPTDPARHYDGEYFRGLCSERRETKVMRGRRVSRYVQTYNRNEPLDCRCYATAAMELAVLLDHFDIDARPAPRPVTEETPAAGEEAPAPALAAPVVRRVVAARPAGRRVLSKGVGW